MIVHVRTGGSSRLEGVSPDLAEKLSEHYAYPVEGAEWSDAYRAGAWDGRKRLLRRRRGKGGDYTVSVPAGLDGEIWALLEQIGAKPICKSELPGLPGVRWDVDRDWIGPRLRGYQDATIGRTTRRTGPLKLPRSGIWRLPIRAGKTLTAAGLTYELAWRTLFVVTSDLLAEQAAGAFAGAIEPLDLRVYRGGGKAALAEAGEGDVVVATIQALSAVYGARAFERFSRRFGLVFLDECHHLQGTDGAWRDVALALKPLVKIGLSATVGFCDRKRPASIDDVWLRAICGPVLASVEMADLMRAGHLLRPRVQICDVPADTPITGGWSPAVYRDGIVRNEARNEALCREVVDHWAAGRRVFIDCSQIGHARGLRLRLERQIPSPEIALLLGSTPKRDRQEILSGFRAGRPRILIGTILGEGVDLPSLEVVVNAEAGRGETPTIQRLRNLTPDPANPGKHPIVVDFLDRAHPTLREWSEDRIQIYRKAFGGDAVHP